MTKPFAGIRILDFTRYVAEQGKLVGAERPGDIAGEIENADTGKGFGHSTARQKNHGGTEAGKRDCRMGRAQRNPSTFRRGFRDGFRCAQPILQLLTSLRPPCLRGEFAYSAACDLSRMVLAISFWRSNSARRRAISSGDSRAMFE